MPETVWSAARRCHQAFYNSPLISFVLILASLGVTGWQPHYQASQPSTPPAKKEENPSFSISYLGARNFYPEPLSDFLLPLLGQKCLFSINHQKGKWDHHLAWMYVGELTMTSTEGEPSFLKKYYMPPWYRADKNRAPRTEVRDGRRPEPLRAPQSPVTGPWSSFTHFENHWTWSLR